LVFGHSEITYYAVPVLTVVLLAVAISNLGRAMFGWWVGPVAALLTVSSNFVFVHATQLLPDIPATAVLTACLAVLYHATRRQPERRTALLVLAGAVFGVAFLMRETVVLFLPGLIAAALLWGARWRGVAMLLAGSLVGPVLDLIGNAVLWGDPLARVNLVFLRTATEGHISVEAAEAAFAEQSNVVKSFSMLPQALWESTLGRAIAVGVVAYLVVICLPKFRNRANWGLPAWVMSAWVVYALVATIRPESGTPVLRLNQIRYWTPFAPALVLMAVGWIHLVTSRLVSQSARRASVVAASLLAGVLVIAAISSSLTMFPNHFIRFGGDAYLQLRDEFRAMPEGARLNVPNGVDTMIQIYANDSVGRPINDIEVLVANEGQADPSGWFLFGFPRHTNPCDGCSIPLRRRTGRHTRWSRWQPLIHNSVGREDSSSLPAHGVRRARSPGRWNWMENRTW
jgi:4-amino-4-deoxy-L-arabinose transferase-like glycosyltransferase